MISGLPQEREAVAGLVGGLKCCFLFFTDLRGFLERHTHSSSLVPPELLAIISPVSHSFVVEGRHD